MQDLFDWEGDKVRVKLWIRKGITWHLGDAEDPDIGNVLGYQDMVVANNFLRDITRRKQKTVCAILHDLSNPEVIWLYQGLIWMFEQRLQRI